MTSIIRISEHLEQMDKGQDQTYTGTAIDEITGETFHYGMVTDGHGENNCIDFLRGISKEKLAEIIGKGNPVETMAAHVNTVIKPHFGGATMCLVKVYKDRIECINSGDSQVAVFKDGILVYLSEEHNWSNESERNRLLNGPKKFRFVKSNAFKLLDDTKLIGCYAEYAVWDHDYALAPTQALGHGGLTGYSPEHKTLPVEPGSEYKIMIASDGVWDMVRKNELNDIQQFASMSGGEAVAFVMSRWLQEWEMSTRPHNQEPGDFVIGQFQKKECDDIGLVMIDITHNA